jgi:hypothetical protein
MIESDNPNPNSVREWPKNHLDYTLRDLAANMMRVCAGAGRPEFIPGQVAELLEALQKGYRENISAYEMNTTVIPHALSVHEAPFAGPSYFEDNITLEERHRRRRDSYVAQAEEHIIKNALRLAAARLLGNGTERYKADRGMFDAIREREKASNEKFNPKEEAKMVSGGLMLSEHRQIIKPSEPKPTKPKTWKQKLQEEEEDDLKRLTLVLASQAAEKSMKAFMKRQRRPDGSRPSFYELRETEPELVRLEYAELRKKIDEARAELDRFDETAKQRR